jgi:hypothetical protein
MINFQFLFGAVYIFENAEAQRIKIGMTNSNITDRLSEVNDKWLERKVTCPICGGRLVNIKGYVPPNVVSGGRCPGGLKLPLEEDLSVAESYLENMKNRLNKLSGTEKGSMTRKINTLEKRLENYRNYDNKIGKWQFNSAFFTDSAGRVELLSHKILANSLDKAAPIGEVFCCSVLEANEAIETALRQLGLLNKARKVTQL